ncbi:hypothetical protein SmJEL517_g01632 [Synchytrium microbalum]|uniref:F-box domain-containing protein n=1 Tax=Synchytrium microbalum TaxID=1806994 RepID=A0A507C9N8_9FUNG|nr:uncharacterized protein SmJEL517_g01632 [Synchytrium microbalum]TPX36322.1 hypothetical protein SmJEL517_g01632 [Synchytrium microbalum]
MLNDIPTELVLKICTYLPLDTNFYLAGTCRSLKIIARDPILYKLLVIPKLHPHKLLDLLSLLTKWNIPLRLLHIQQTDPKYKTRHHHQRGLDLEEAAAITTATAAPGAQSTLDSKYLLNRIISFLESCDVGILASLIIEPCVWMGCKTEEVLKLFRRTPCLKRLHIPSPTLFADNFIVLTTHLPLMERISGITYTPTPRAIHAIGTNWLNLTALDVSDDHAGYEIAHALALVFSNCKSLVNVRISQVVPCTAGWAAILKTMEKAANTTIYATDEDGDVIMQTCNNKIMKTSATSTISSSSSTMTSMYQMPTMAESVTHLELSVMCYCRNAARLLDVTTCHILKRIFPNVNRFVYHYEGALRGVDVEATRNELNEFARKWVGDHGIAKIVV